MSNIIKRDSITTLTKSQQQIMAEYDGKSYADNTKKAYKTAIKRFLMLGGTFPTTSLGLRAFIAKLKDDNLRAETISLYINAVCAQQRALGFDTPRTDKVDEFISNIRRNEERSTRKGDTFTKEELINLISAQSEDNTDKGIRDRFVTLIMLWSACRTDEIANLNFDDIKVKNNNICLHIDRSKTDQKGESHTLTIPILFDESEGENEILKNLCLHYAFEQYSKIALNHDYLIKRLNKNGKLTTQGVTTRSLRGILERTLQRCGFNEERIHAINGHSFRHTLATLASELNINTLTIQLLGNWKTIAAASAYTGNQRAEAVKSIAQNLAKTSK